VSGVRVLNRRVCALPVQEVHDSGERGDVVVLPDAEVVRGDSPLGKNSGGFREDEACTSGGAAAKMDQMPVVGEAVAAGVLAHRRDSDAVGQSEIANGNRREELGHSLWRSHHDLGRLQVGLDVSRIEKSVCGMIEDGEPAGGSDATSGRRELDLNRWVGQC